MKEIKNCVVGILVDGILQGTGYLATRELVITSAHVLTDSPKPPAKGISVRFHCNGEEFPVKVLSDRWSPTEKDDIAVLKVVVKKGKTLPAGAEVATLGRSAGRKNRECEVFGYPDVANINGLGGHAKIIQYVKDDAGRELIQLESSQVTSGYSGSPLYDPVTHEVIGTIVEIAEQALARYSPDLHGRLDKLAFATPIEAIKKVVPDLPVDTNDSEALTHESVRKRIREEVLKILAAHIDATQRLASEIKGMQDLKVQAACEKVADYLLDASLDDFLQIVVVKGFLSHHRTSSDVAKALLDVATYALPQVYKKGPVQEVRRRLNSVDNFLVIQASHESIIELIVAGALGRRLAFEGNWTKGAATPKSKDLVNPNAELGIVDGKVEEKFIDGFERAIMTKVGGLAGEFRDRTKVIQMQLANRRKQQPPVRFFYIYPAGQGRVEELERCYSDIIFVSHEMLGFQPDEANVLDQLWRMFCPEGTS